MIKKALGLDRETNNVFAMSEASAADIPMAKEEILSQVSADDIPGQVPPEEKPDEHQRERNNIDSSGSEIRPSRLATLDLGQKLEDILHAHSVRARGRVYDHGSFIAAKMKLQAMMFPNMTIGNSGLNYFLNPRPLLGLIEFKEFLDASMGVFAHCGLSVTEFVMLDGPGIGPIAFDE